MKPCFASPFAAVLSLGLLGCMGVDTSTNEAPAIRIELSASDWSGEPADPQQLPRRPRLALRAQQGFSPAADALLLFEGAPDSDLVADLQQAPLRDEHRARLVPSELSFDTSEATLSPRVTLAPDASYTFALPGWARTRLGAAPPADKAAIVYRIRTAAKPDAGSRVVASWPAEAAAGVGTNLEAAVIAFDGFVEDAAKGSWIEGPDGLAIETEVTAGACSSIAPEQTASFCVRLLPSARLAPNAEYALVVGTDAHDSHAAPVGPWRAFFRTAAGSDVDPPTSVPLSCAIDEQSVGPGCVLLDDGSVSLRVLVDEAVVASLRIGDARAFAVAPNGEARLRLSGLAPDSALSVELSLRDSSGHALYEELALRTLAPLPTLSITEVRADALGPEPQQEFVELLNYGTQVVDLQGFVLEDRADAAGTPIGRPLLLAPQTRALLVADGFDPNDPHDAAPPPGTPLLRVGRALAGTGLSNSGAALFLRDAQGHRVSAAPATPPPRPGVCMLRTSTDMRDGSTHTFDYDAHDTCTPGR